jgi:DNA replication protein DnaC
MGVAQAKNLMAEMKFHGMLKGFDRIINIAQNDSWGNIEIIDALLQEEYDSRKARKIESKIKTSKLRLKPELEDFDFTAGRSITKAEIKDLYKITASPYFRNA